MHCLIHTTLPNSVITQHIITIINSKWTVVEWYKELVGWATRLFLTCYVIVTVHLSIRNIMTNKNECYCFSRHYPQTTALFKANVAN